MQAEMETMSIIDALKKDAQRMEDAACDLTMTHKVSIGKILYWCCVANLHIIEWIIKRGQKEGNNT